MDLIENHGRDFKACWGLIFYCIKCLPILKNRFLVCPINKRTLQSTAIKQKRFIKVMP